MAAVTPIPNTQTAYEMIREYFSRPGAKLARDKNPSPFLNFDCKYRTPDGRKCAVGCLIPDELYNSRIEEKDVDDLLQIDEMSKLFAHVDRFFLKRAQSAHDSNTTVDAADFVRNLDQIAEAFRLKTPKEANR